jgi:hypothetical protein
VLRMALWRSSKCTLAMEEVHQEDQEQHECQDQLKELLEVRRCERCCKALSSL